MNLIPAKLADAVTTHASMWLLAICVFAWPMYQSFMLVPDKRFATNPKYDHGNAELPVFQEKFITPEGFTKSVHSATLAEDDAGVIHAVWYGGSREGGRDVALYTATLRQEWNPPRRLIGRIEAQDQLGRYIKKIGNPVLLSDDKSDLWLFYVSVSVGGWSGSAINVMRSVDNGGTWSTSRRLITTPFFNVSSLLKGTPFFFEDGSIGLPIYHEFFGKFSELLHLSADGEVIRKHRLSWGKTSLQPVIVPLSSTHAVGFMRYSGSTPKRILEIKSTDGGNNWTQPVKTKLANPNAAVTAVAGQDLLLVFNQHEEERHDLTLAKLMGGDKGWRILYKFENQHKLVGQPTPPGKREFSYPYLIQAKNGMFHLVYTWHKRRIKHISFNQTWLESLPGLMNQ